MMIDDQVIDLGFVAGVGAREANQEQLTDALFRRHLLECGAYRSRRTTALCVRISRPCEHADDQHHQQEAKEMHASVPLLSSISPYDRVMHLRLNVSARQEEHRQAAL